MRTRAPVLSILIAASVIVFCVGTAHAAGRSFGAGIHYLRTLGDISEDDAISLKQDSFSLLGSMQNGLGPITLDTEVEYIFDYIGTGNEMWQPSLWALLGKMIYGGAGIGIGYTDGDWQKNPFYALRAGVQFPLGGLALDGYASYRLQKNKEIEDITGEDLDSITFAALLRFGGGSK